MNGSMREEVTATLAVAAVMPEMPVVAVVDRLLDVVAMADSKQVSLVRCHWVDTAELRCSFTQLTGYSWAEGVGADIKMTTWALLVVRVAVLFL
ncbi:MAG: hypothetical protein D8M52_03440 [Chlorobi bacterium]|nr:hypothetical protein [Chlorobiota bacterium]